MNKKPILLLGNGINRATNGHGWEELIKNLAKKIGIDPKVISREVPLNLLFERFVIESNKSEFEIKQKVAEVLNPVRPNELHAKIGAIFDDVLTTNYDLSTEIALDIDLRPTDTFKESRYSLFRCYGKGSSKCVWHIHGDIHRSNSLTLGHDHYSGQLQKLRNFMGGGVDVGGQRISFREIERHNTIASWVSLFFCRDVHIVGLGMDYSEIDLWWLLVHKVRAGNINRYVGKIVYWDIRDEKPKTKMENSMLKLLNGFGVKVQEVSGRTYLDAYHSAVLKLRKI